MTQSWKIILYMQNSENNLMNDGESKEVTEVKLNCPWTIWLVNTCSVLNNSKHMVPIVKVSYSSAQSWAIIIFSNSTSLMPYFNQCWTTKTYRYSSILHEKCIDSTYFWSFHFLFHLDCKGTTHAVATKTKMILWKQFQVWAAFGIK